MVLAAGLTGAPIRAGIGVPDRDTAGVMTGVMTGVASAAILHHAALFHLVDDRDCQETRSHLRHDVRTGIVHRDAPIIESSQSDRRVEVAAGDAAREENQDSQRRTDRPRVAGRHDDAQKYEGSQELHQNSNQIHSNATGDFLPGD